MIKEETLFLSYSQSDRIDLLNDFEETIRLSKILDMLLSYNFIKANQTCGKQTKHFSSSTTNACRLPLPSSKPKKKSTTRPSALLRWRKLRRFLARKSSSTRRLTQLRLAKSDRRSLAPEFHTIRISDGHFQSYLTALLPYYSALLLTVHVLLRF